MLPDHAAADPQREALQQHHRAFHDVLARSRRSLDAGHPERAAGLLAVAANLAVWAHPGQFASGELEQLAIDIGSRAAGSSGWTWRRPVTSVRSVLHVTTMTSAIGGHSRMLWRWVESDPTRRHSVVMTRQRRGQVPAELHAAVAASGGRVDVLDARPGSLLDRVRAVRALVEHHDLVVLHVHGQDVVPALALAAHPGAPVVAYLDHADHAFWCGVGCSDLLVSLRTSGGDLARRRRAFSPDAVVTVPIVLDERGPTQPREQAKRALGLDEDALVLLTIARPEKFEPGAGTGYLAPLLPVLQAHPRAVLLVVGREQDGAFAAAHAETGGRVRAFGPRTDTSRFYEAADLYVDSAPQPSITSLLEAGRYGVPLVALHPARPGAELLGADAPGLDPVLRRTGSAQELQGALHHLLEDGRARADLGARTRASIAARHVGAGWAAQRDGLYAAAVALPGGRRRPVLPDDVARSGEPDRSMVSTGGPRLTEAQVTPHQMRMLPLRDRLATYVDLARRREPASASHLLPEHRADQLAALLGRRAGAG